MQDMLSPIKERDKNIGADSGSGTAGALCDSHGSDTCGKSGGTGTFCDCVWKLIFPGADYLSGDKIPEGYGGNMGYDIR